MTAMIFKLRGEPDQRLDLSCLVPERLGGLSEAEIAALPINTGKRGLTVGDAFQITMGDAADIRIAGGGERLDGIGTGLAAGRIVVEGRAGAFSGRLMSGGELRVEGNSGPHAGSGMSGGLIVIGGDSGDWLGGPKPGEMHGMRGGTIVVSGRVGARAGDRMRRGLIAVGGDAGDFPASRMIAGTLAILGGCGQMPGYLMRRGTLFLGREPSVWTPTFADSGRAELTVFRLMARALKEHLPADRLAVFDGMLHRHAGDMAALGKGEILRPAA